jgi:hypothetical protein
VVGQGKLQHAATIAVLVSTLRRVIHSLSECFDLTENWFYYLLLWFPPPSLDCKHSSSHPRMLFSHMQHQTLRIRFWVSNWIRKGKVKNLYHTLILTTQDLIFHLRDFLGFNTPFQNLCLGEMLNNHEFHGLQEREMAWEGMRVRVDWGPRSMVDCMLIWCWEIKDWS